MAVTQFAMVEELASLIKDNLSCKHLVLSIEEVLVNFLQDDTSTEGVIELQPMSPYERLLLHRLAEIYGFAHESVGEGDDRHLVLERCPDTAIPAILVSDILWQHDDYHSPTPSHHILRRKDVPEPKKSETFPSTMTFEEREAAYLAARERIFSLHVSDEKEVTAPKSRKIPVVAQRMIAHALGTKIKSSQDANLDAPATDKKSEEYEPSSSEHANESTAKPNHPEKKTSDKPTSKKGGNLIQNGNNGRVVNAENLEREQRGAAKRIFAHALGLTPGKLTHVSPVKANQVDRPCRQHDI